MTFRKDAEISGVNSKLESEQALVAQLQKKIKELQVSNQYSFGSILYTRQRRRELKKVGSSKLQFSDTDSYKFPTIN